MGRYLLQLVEQTHSSLVFLSFVVAVLVILVMHFDHPLQLLSVLIPGLLVESFDFVLVFLLLLLLFVYVLVLQFEDSGPVSSLHVIL